MKPKGRFKRVIWVVLDGVGAGALPDAEEFGDVGSNTLGNLAREYPRKSGRKLDLPNLARYGIGNITEMEGVPACAPAEGAGAFGRAAEMSNAKDSTSGHWEMAGLVVSQPFKLFPKGFPSEVIKRWVKENYLPGILGNKAASGTEIIKELGEEHLRTGKPIVYTSGDSVWQVAAHEEYFGLDRLYEVCKSAYAICQEIGVGRVIARPFVGDSADNFKRTYNRKDLTQPPHGRTFLDLLSDLGVNTLGIGKISSLFSGNGISESVDTSGNTDGIRVLLEKLESVREGLIFCNLIDFDMLYGHRRDVEGFATALEEVDAAMPEIARRMGPEDLFIMTADHGNDPTFRGTDHTREYIPILAFSPAQQPGLKDLGIRDSFADIGATVVDALAGQEPIAQSGLTGASFLDKLDLQPEGR